LISSSDSVASLGLTVSTSPHQYALSNMHHATIEVQIVNPQRKSHHRESCFGQNPVEAAVGLVLPKRGLVRNFSSHFLSVGWAFARIFESMARLQPAGTRVRQAQPHTVEPKSHAEAKVSSFA
jgi:hypothetical protein